MFKDGSCLPSPQLQGCAYSNVVGLLGTMLAFCLYCYNLSILHKEPCVMPLPDHFRRSPYDCPGEALAVSVFLSVNFLSEDKYKQKTDKRRINRRGC